MQRYKYSLININDSGRHLQIATGDWKQLNYIEILKGKTRGGHYHKKDRELFFITEGVVRLTVNGTKWLIVEREAFEIEPEEIHTIEGITEIAKMIVLHTEVFNEKKPDIYK